MRSREYYWSLYHTTENNQLDNLRTDQVEAVHASIPKRCLQEWMIWRDGFESWKPLEDFPQLLISLRKVDQTQEAPPPPPAKAKPKKPNASKPASSRPGAGKDPKDIDHLTSMTGLVDLAPSQTQADFEFTEPGPDLSFETPNSLEERNNFRFEKSFEVRLIHGSQVYNNRTVNISLKGMQLQQPIPAGLPRYFNVEVRKGDKVVQVVCSVVRTADGVPADRLKIEVNDFTPALLSMLLDA